MSLPIAAKLEAFWNRFLDHVEPDRAFQTIVTDSLKHLEQRIEDVAKGAMPVDVAKSVHESFDHFMKVLDGLATTTEAEYTALKARVDEIAAHPALAIPPLAPPAHPTAGPEAVPSARASAAPEAGSNRDEDPQGKDGAPGEKQAGGEGSSAGS